MISSEKPINQPAPEQIKQEIPMQIPDGGGVSEKSGSG